MEFAHGALESTLLNKSKGYGADCSQQEWLWVRIRAKTLLASFAIGNAYFKVPLELRGCATQVMGSMKNKRAYQVAWRSTPRLGRPTSCCFGEDLECDDCSFFKDSLLTEVSIHTRTKVNTRVWAVESKLREREEETILKY